VNNILMSNPDVKCELLKASNGTNTV